MSSFQERFKGKTTLMTKEGITALAMNNAKPVPKDPNVQYPQNTQYEEDFEEKRYIPVQNIKRESLTFNDRPLHVKQTNTNIYSQTNQNYNKPKSKQSTPNSNLASTDDPFLINNPFSIQQKKPLQSNPNQNNYQISPKHQQFEPQRQNQFNSNPIQPQKLTQPLISAQQAPPNPQQLVFIQQMQQMQQFQQFQQQQYQLQQLQQFQQPFNFGYQPQLPNFLPVQPQFQQENLQDQQSYYQDNSDILSQQLQNERSKVNYKPYTLQEFRQNKKLENFDYKGLGPNIGGKDWQVKREKIQKMQEFSQQVKYINQQQHSLPPSNNRRKDDVNQKQIGPREKAKEFAKNIPKPPQKKLIAQQTGQENPKNGNVLPSDILEEDNPIYQYERQHLNLKSQLEKLNIN